MYQFFRHIWPTKDKLFHFDKHQRRKIYLMIGRIGEFRYQGRSESSNFNFTLSLLVLVLILILCFLILYMSTVSLHPAGIPDTKDLGW